MSEPLALSLGQQFELERMSRAIDATLDPQALQGLAKQLLQAWHSQKAATQWVMRQQLGSARAFGGSADFDPGLLDSLRSEPGRPSPDVL
ncbi:MAG: hypothetical protein ACK55X_16025 [Synechococcaceae cyanobacterium]|jgi:hypothetical protein